jgi:hypothetical protein
MEKQYWELIIEKSKEKPTLPYVIGSKKILFPTSEYDSIEKLLGEIIESENNEIYSMFYCPTIGEYVIFHNKYKDYLMKGLEIKSPKNQNLKMIFGLNMEILGKTFEEIKNKLVNRYKLCIDDEKFSYKNRIWKPFTEQEKKSIINLKNL